MTDYKLTYADARTHVRRLMTENPKATNPMSGKLCVYDASAYPHKQKTTAMPNCIVGAVLVAAGLPLPTVETGWYDITFGDGPDGHASQEYLERGDMSKETCHFLAEVQAEADIASCATDDPYVGWGAALRRLEHRGIL